MTKKGFTIIEALVAVTVLGILGVIAIDLLFKTFQANNKAQLISKIKQNGQISLATMEEYFRSANAVACIDDYEVDADPSTFDTIVVVKDGNYTRVRFYEERVSPSANGYIATDTAFSSGDDAILCMEGQISPQILTDQNTTNGVSLKYGNFAKDSSGGAKDLVIVQFKLGSPINAPFGFDTQIAPVDFKTKIQLR